MSVHDNLVSQLITHLVGDRFQNIKADLPEYDQPNAIWWTNKPDEKFIPDATATKNDVPFIFEVETADSIGIDHSDAQWKVFAASASKNSGHFCLYVEEGAEDAAKRRVQELGITADVW